MKSLDAVKAVGLAVLIMALNVAVAFAAVRIYATLVEPGKPQTYYAASAPRIAGWSAPIAGAVLFLAATWLLGRRRPARNAFKFAGMAWLAYLIIDVGSGAASASVPAMLSLQMAASMGLALTGAMAGAALARPKSNPPRRSAPDPSSETAT